MIKVPAHVINIRFGSMINEETKLPFDWAKATVIEDAPEIKDGYAGVKVGELKFNTDKNNIVVKELHQKVVKGELEFPCNLIFDCELTIKQKDVAMVIHGYELV